MEPSGNLVLYRNYPAAPTVYRTSSTPQPGNYLSLDSKGILRIIGKDGYTVRWTGPALPGEAGPWYFTLTGDVDPTGDGTALVNPRGDVMNVGFTR